MNQQARCVVSALFAAVSVSAAGPARAEVTVSGDVSPASPTDPWDLGASPLLVGGTVEGPPRSGSVFVYNRGTLISAGAVLGGPNEEGSGTVEVTGYRSRWINDGSLELGGHESSTGALIVRRGAQVITDDLVVSGPYPHAYGSVLVEGYDASLTSRTIAYIGHMWGGKVELRQGASFFSHDVWFGYTGYRTPFGPIQASITGSGTRWVSTGEFIMGAGGRAAQLSIYRGELSTVNAVVVGSNYENSVVSVSGWGGTWTNEELLQVGGDAGFGGVVLGAHGTLVTGETVLRSQGGSGYIFLEDVYSSWSNRGDVTILASLYTPVYPALQIDGGGSVNIDGTLRVGPLPGGPSGPMWAVLLSNGSLTAGEIELQANTGFSFYRGRLDTGRFVGDLSNTAFGTLVAGEAHAVTSIAGSYTQMGFASMSLTVAAPGAAPLLFVDGDLSLGGALEVRAEDDSAPFQAGDTVTLLGWGGALIGAFESVDIDLPLAPGLAWDTSALYLTGQIVAVPG
ncbi:hypothetical protein WMF37_00665 [Sorangium sp. So ce291]|uniref:hypothetical protein n=1 Tax=Sorangium sp. So ce291 TaxID=3133294 RepID=UPI003F5EFB8F